MHRAPMLALVLATALTVPVTGAEIAAGTVEDTGALGRAGGHVANVTGPIDTIVAPTSGAPSFVLTGDELRVELAPDDGLAAQVAGAGDVNPPTVRLVSSFGEGGQAVPVDAQGVQASERWEGPYARDVVVLTGAVPETLDPGLYDIEIPSIDASARRALSVHEEWPDRPQIVLLADTQTGDPRALADGFEGSSGIHPLAPHESDPHVPPDPGPLNESLNRTFGVDVVNLEIDPADRWGAYRAAIERVNQLDPDLVLFSGDLNFGQLYPGSWHVEYEEAWALLNGGTGVDGTTYEGIHAPTLVSPGNHDGYIQSGEDGLAFWQAYFGPPAYSTSFSNITFVSVNTYDWSELDRMGAAYAVSAWGGQVRGEQLSWLRAELCQANGGTPTDDGDAIAGVGCEGAGDERVVTFAHHSPSWVQDEWNKSYGGYCLTVPCQGTPVAEQFARGFNGFTDTGQAWSGENRLELRETFREFDVDLHAAGHTHRDRVARDVGDGTIVETPQQQRPGLSPTQLHRVQPDGTASEIPYEEGEDLLRNGTGPLYIETTTTASETDEYFGFRPVAWHPSPAAFPEDARGIAPFETGFPMTQELLDQLANEPSHWNASHAELGLFSTPTFLSQAN